MLTLRAAASLLANADSLTALRPIARALGFHDAPHSVSENALKTIGVHELVDSVDITRGPGALRLLAAVLAPHAGGATTTHARELVRRLCTTVARNAPTRRWCIITLDDTRSTISLATVTPHPTGPRIAVLRLDRTHVVDSDADTLRALAAVTDLDDHLRHARFTDILKRDALSTRFYHALERTVTALAQTATGTASRAERIELSLLCTSRCLFLAFLEAKGWLDHDRNFLLHRATSILEQQRSLHTHLLRPLFFGTLNTPIAHRAPAALAFGAIPFLNGGLFAPTPLERKRHTLRFADDALASLIGELLDRYRFTAHEDSTAWSEAAVDPEMLGRAFECLMAQDERRRSGSFYTPPSLVNQVVEDALHAALPTLPHDAFDQHTTPLHLDETTRAQLLAMRVLDPACGSGAFLVHTLESVARILQRGGDPRPQHQLRRDLLTSSIFGVDRNPIAVWLCELRLWLSVVIECPETRPTLVPPLPNLDHHIRVGDALAGGDFRFAPPSARKLTTLRERYTRASGPRKHTLATALDLEERSRAIGEATQHLAQITHQRCALIESLRTPDLFGEKRRRTPLDTLRLRELRTHSRDIARRRTSLQLGAALPFRFAAHFADVAAAGGFQLILGNPPWVRPHALPIAERQRLRKDFQTFHRATWTIGAKRAGATTGFAAQADLSAAFIERGTQLLAPDGTLAMLVPAKLWRALAGGGTRAFLAQHTRIQRIRDWSEAPPLFDAATYPSLIVASRDGRRVATHEPRMTPPSDWPQSDSPHLNPQPSTTTAPPRSLNRSLIASRPTTIASAHRDTLVKRSPHPVVHISVARRRHTHQFTTAPHQLALGADPSAPWLLLPPAVHDAFERLRLAGPPLGDSTLGRPLLGVKCGLNAAFLVTAVEHDDDTATVTADNRSALVERQLLRPMLRGEHIADAHRRLVDNRRTRGSDPDTRILWTHDTDGKPLRTLPPRAARWLAHWRRQLEARRDARSQTPWWSLFRTEAARHEVARLVWADIGKTLRTRVLPAGDPTVPLNSCYVLRTPALDDAFALNALLTAPVCRAWLDCLAEPARGGFRRYLGWTVASLPLPPDWPTARAALADVGRRLDHGQLSPDEHTDLVADAYGIPVTRLQPLLDWANE